MKCTFFGHRNAPLSVKTKLTECIEKLIKENGARVFYVGTQGSFDRLVWESLCVLKSNHPHIICYKVLAYFPVNNDCNPGNTLYPEGLEAVPRKFAISKRNEWMISQADAVISYISHSGGADTFVNLAKRKGKLVIEL